MIVPLRLSPHLAMTATTTHKVMIAHGGDLLLPLAAPKTSLLPAASAAATALLLLPGIALGRNALKATMRGTKIPIPIRISATARKLHATAFAVC